MKTFILLFTSLVFYSCTSSLEPKEYTQSPCMDITYQKLLKMDIKDMTNSEVEYFKIKDRECLKFTADQKEVNSEKKQATTNLIWILSGLGFLFAVALYLSIALKGWH
jgi:hypothetical protein